MGRLIFAIFENFDWDKNDDGRIDHDTLMGKIINKDIVSFIAKMSDGGMRDAINMLDQVIALNGKNISVEDVCKLLGEVTNDELFTIMDSIFNQDMLGIINILNVLYEKGSNFDNICNKLQVLIVVFNIFLTFSLIFSPILSYKI